MVVCFKPGGEGFVAAVKGPHVAFGRQLPVDYGKLGPTESGGGWKVHATPWFRLGVATSLQPSGGCTILGRVMPTPVAYPMTGLQKSHVFSKWELRIGSRTMGASGPMRSATPPAPPAWER